MKTFLALALFFAALSLHAAGQVYPPHTNVVNVTRPPYGAKGDGVTDDTEALQRALHENVGLHRVLYFPKGTYLVSATLKWPKKFGGHDNWGKTMLRGEHRDLSILRLKDSTFTNAANAGAIMTCGGFGSADWFHNYVENLTFDVGAKNPSAIGLQFYSNNSGAVRDCRFVAGEGSGLVGLDLGFQNMNGPLFVSRCEVVGFRRGIATAGSVNSQVFEHITLRGQSQFGFDNEGQAISLRGMASENAVPALRSYGKVTLLEARLTGREAAAKMPAIINYNGGRLFLRDITTTGYREALGDVKSPDWTAALRLATAEKASTASSNIAEYASEPITSPFPTPATSLRLPLKETPETIWDDPARWAVVDSFGADPTGRKDSAEAIQKAIDSGSTTVFLPGHYRLLSTVIIRGFVRRVLGLGGMINYGHPLHPDFRIGDGAAPTVFVEHFSAIHGGLELDTRRTLVVRSVQDCNLTSTAAADGGEIFFEDVVTHDLKLRRQRAWARQLNIENEGTHLTNDGGNLWILGYKTERGGTLLHTHGGGRSELLGGFSYTTTAGKLAPMLVNDDSSVFAFFAEVCYSGDPFALLVRETRGGLTKVVKRGEGNTIPYSGYTRP